MVDAYQLPKNLAFPCAPAREGKSADNPKNRNPSIGDFKFPRLKTDPSHAEWNLKASWILSEVVMREGNLFNMLQGKGLRAIEAALFMVGCDLGGAGVGPVGGSPGLLPV